jgi:hypothetical protein
VGQLAAEEQLVIVVRTVYQVEQVQVDFLDEMVNQV